MGDMANSSTQIESLVAGEKKILLAKSNFVPTIFSGGNLVMLIFLAFAAVFGSALHIGTLEIALIGLIVVVLTVPVIQKTIFQAFTSYLLTDQRILISTGWMGKTRHSIYLKDILSVKVRKPFMQKKARTGDVVVRVQGWKKPYAMQSVVDCDVLADRIKKLANLKK